MVYCQNSDSEKLSSLSCQAKCPMLADLQFSRGSSHFCFSLEERKTFRISRTIGENHLDVALRVLYRVTNLLADWVGLTLIWDVPLSYLGSTSPTDCGTPTQPRSAKRWVTLYCPWILERKKAY